MCRRFDCCHRPCLRAVVRARRVPPKDKIIRLGVLALVDLFVVCLCKQIDVYVPVALKIFNNMSKACYGCLVEPFGLSVSLQMLGRCCQAFLF